MLSSDNLQNSPVQDLNSTSEFDKESADVIFKATKQRHMTSVRFTCLMYMSLSYALF